MTCDLYCTWVLDFVLRSYCRTSVITCELITRAALLAMGGGGDSFPRSGLLPGGGVLTGPGLLTGVGLLTGGGDYVGEAAGGEGSMPTAVMS